MSWLIVVLCSYYQILDAKDYGTAFTLVVGFHGLYLMAPVRVMRLGHSPSVSLLVYGWLVAEGEAQLKHWTFSGKHALLHHMWLLTEAASMFL